MSRKPKPPSVEESLKSVVADVAKLKKEVAQLKAAREQNAAKQITTDLLPDDRHLWDKWGFYAPPAKKTMEEELLMPLSKAKQIGDIRLRHVIMSHGYVFGVNPDDKTTILVCARPHLRREDVRYFVNKRMPAFVGRCSKIMWDKNKFTGMIIYRTMRGNSTAAAEALKSGLLLVRDEGEKGMRQIKTPAAARNPKTAASAVVKRPEKDD